MTADEINAYATLIVAIGTLITGIATAIIGIRNGRIGKENAAKSDAISEKVDGAASASVTKIEGLQANVADLHAKVAEQTQTAALLAQAVIEKDRKP